MSYGFDMGFAQANSLQEAMTIALELVLSRTSKLWHKYALLIRANQR